MTKPTEQKRKLAAFHTSLDQANAHFNHLHKVVNYLYGATELSTSRDARRLAISEFRKGNIQKEMGEPDQTAFSGSAPGTERLVDAFDNLFWDLASRLNSVLHSDNSEVCRLSILEMYLRCPQVEQECLEPLLEKTNDLINKTIQGEGCE